MKPKQGRTSDEEIQQRINEVRAAIKGPKSLSQAEYLRKWSGSFKVFANNLEEREDYAFGPDGDYAVRHWPQKLRDVADEAENAAGIFSKAPEARTPEENLYPGMAPHKE